MAKNILFYFTGTGNSLAVAKSIANKLEDTILMPILDPDALSIINQQTERIGLVFPIHINSIPWLLEKFIERMQNLPHIYYFAIATHGGKPGMTELYLNKLFNKQQITLNAYFEIKMINNTPKGIAPKFLMTMNWEEDIRETHVNKMMEDTQIILEKVSRKIQNKKQETIQYPPKGIKKLSYLGMNILWYINKKSKPKLAFVLDENQYGFIMIVAFAMHVLIFVQHKQSA